MTGGGGGGTNAWTVKVRYPDANPYVTLDEDRNPYVMLDEEEGVEMR